MWLDMDKPCFEVGYLSSRFDKSWALWQMLWVSQCDKSWVSQCNKSWGLWQMFQVSQCDRSWGLWQMFQVSQRDKSRFHNATDHEGCGKYFKFHSVTDHEGCGKCFRFHSVWLRYNCLCGQCRQEHSGQRLFDPASVPHQICIDDACINGTCMISCLMKPACVRGLIS